MKNNKHFTQFKSERNLKNILLETVNAVKQQTGSYPTNFELACYINEIAGDMVTVKGMEAGVAVSDATLSSFARQLNEGAAEFVIGLHETAQATHEWIMGQYLTEEMDEAEFLRRQTLLNAPENESVFRKMGRVVGANKPNSITAVLPRVGGEVVGQALGRSFGLPGEFLGTMAGGKLASDWWNSKRIAAGKPPMDPSLRGWRPGGAAGFLLGGRLANAINDKLGTGPLTGFGIDLAGMIGGEMIGNKLQQKYGARLASTGKAALEPVTAALSRGAAAAAERFPGAAEQVRKIGADVRSAAGKIRGQWIGPEAVAAENAARNAAATTSAASTAAESAARTAAADAWESGLGSTVSGSKTGTAAVDAATDAAKSTIRSGALEAEVGAAKGLGSAAAKAGTEAAAEAATKAAGTVASETAAKAVGTAAAEVGAKAAAKGLGKAALKALPGIGLLAGLYFAGHRALEGDWGGAAAEAAAGGLSLLPGAGTAASLAITAGLAGRDIYKATQGSGAKAEQSPTSGQNIPEIRKQPMPFGLPGRYERAVSEDTLLEVNALLIENCASPTNKLHESVVSAGMRAVSKAAEADLLRAAEKAAEEGLIKDAGRAAERSSTTPVETIRSGGIEANPRSRTSRVETPQSGTMQRVASSAEKGAGIGTTNALLKFLRPSGRSVMGVYDDTKQNPGIPDLEREPAFQTTGIRMFSPATGDFIFIPHTQIVR